jgi:hypothetical protein
MTRPEGAITEKSMNQRLLTLASIFAFALPLEGHADFPEWAARDPDFARCKDAIRREIGSNPGVSVDDTYWMERHNGETQLYLNAEGSTGAVRGTCTLKRSGRIVALETQPGRFVDGAAEDLARAPADEARGGSPES